MIDYVVGLAVAVAMVIPGIIDKIDEGRRLLQEEIALAERRQKLVADQGRYEVERGVYR